MHKLQVIFGPDFFKRPAQLLSTFGCQVGTDYAQYRIHGVIHRTGINGKPGDLPLQCPVDKLTGGSGVHVEITNLVRLAFTIPVALIIFVVAGMHHHNIARLDPYARLTLPLLKVVRGIDLIIPNAHGFQVHYYPRPHQLVQRNTANILSFVTKCSGASRCVPTCSVDEMNCPPTFSKAGRLIHLTVGPSYVAKEGVFTSQFCDRSITRMWLRSIGCMISSPLIAAGEDEPRPYCPTIIWSSR